MSRFIRRILGKDEEEEEEVQEAPAEEVEEAEEAVETEPEPAPEAEAEVEAPPEGRADTLPYHSTIQDRLMYLFKDSNTGSGIEGTDEFTLEFMAMGERFSIGKEKLGEVEMKPGSSSDHDAHIRIANELVPDLLSAATFYEFSKMYLNYYKNAEAGKFVKIEVRKPITDLNRRGYARVPIMKLLIGAAR
ncbi:hypothetical protein EU546_01420 [Candidatus Thorarchaeota archaeon]|nr:MAG: hypothetical protein EU546_01420 [Candidatus Thorarchaeota archaeon]